MQNSMNERFPKVSIVLVNHNGAKYLRESIDSCLNQTHTNIELIVVDDTSTDDSQEILKAYSDERIKLYICNETNLGLANSLNRGFSHATGDYLTWTSYDNVYSKNAIEAMTRELGKYKNIDFVYANFYKIDEKGKTIARTKVKPIKELDIGNCIGYCFLYRRKIYQELGGYDPSCRLAEDYEYWLRIRSKFKMKRLGGYLYYARFHRECLRSKYPQEVEEAGKKVRDKYISDISKKYYLMAKEYSLKGDKANCMLFLKKSMLRDPLDLEAIRLLAITLLPDFLVKMIRRVKRNIWS